MGRYWNPEDQLHLGSKGIGLLVRLIRRMVYDSVISPSRMYREYSSVVQGNGVDRAGRGHRAAISSQFDVAAT